MGNIIKAKDVPYEIERQYLTPPEPTAEFTRINDMQEEIYRLKNEIPQIENALDILLDFKVYAEKHSGCLSFNEREKYIDPLIMIINRKIENRKEQLNDLETTLGGYAE